MDYARNPVRNYDLSRSRYRYRVNITKFNSVLAIPFPSSTWKVGNLRCEGNIKWKSVYIKRTLTLLNFSILLNTWTLLRYWILLAYQKLTDSIQWALTFSDKKRSLRFHDTSFDTSRDFSTRDLHRINMTAIQLYHRKW